MMPWLALAAAVVMAVATRAAPSTVHTNQGGSRRVRAGNIEETQQPAALCPASASQLECDALSRCFFDRDSLSCQLHACMHFSKEACAEDPACGWMTFGGCRTLWGDQAPAADLPGGPAPCSHFAIEACPASRCHPHLPSRTCNSLPWTPAMCFLLVCKGPCQAVEGCAYNKRHGRCQSQEQLQLDEEREEQEGRARARRCSNFLTNTTEDFFSNSINSTVNKEENSSSTTTTAITTTMTTTIATVAVTATTAIRASIISSTSVPTSILTTSIASSPATTTATNIPSVIETITTTTAAQKETAAVETKTTAIPLSTVFTDAADAKRTTTTTPATTKLTATMTDQVGFGKIFLEQKPASNKAPGIVKECAGKSSTQHLFS